MPLDQLTALSGDHPGVQAAHSTQVVHGRERACVLKYSASFLSEQVHSLSTSLATTTQALRRLSVELARPAVTSGLWQRPWLMAVLFGFLHGLGFAGALREAGLPAGAIPLALLCFNAGIELGQLAFVAAVVGLYSAGRALALPAPAWGRALAVYAIGSLAAFWVIERAVPLASLGWPG